MYEERLHHDWNALYARGVVTDIIQKAVEAIAGWCI